MSLNRSLGNTFATCEIELTLHPDLSAEHTSDLYPDENGNPLRYHAVTDNQGKVHLGLAQYVKGQFRDALSRIFPMHRQAIMKGEMEENVVACHPVGTCIAKVRMSAAIIPQLRARLESRGISITEIRSLAAEETISQEVAEKTVPLAGAPHQNGSVPHRDETAAEWYDRVTHANAQTLHRR